MINSLKENYCLLWDCIIWGPDIVWEWGSRSIPKEVIFKVGSEESVWVSQGITGGENATTESEKMSKYLEVGKSWKYSNWIVRMEIEEWAWRHLSHAWCGRYKLWFRSKEQSSAWEKDGACFPLPIFLSYWPSAKVCGRERTFNQLRV